ncbi:response regulator transcription factor [Nocardia sp. NPDC003963]
MRVLLVEDEKLLAATVRRGLEAAGFVVDVADNGIDGLAIARTDPFDVIVLDIMLPGLSGYEVLRRLRTHDIETPVLMLTAKSGEFEEADAFDLGADNYLTKPFSFVVLTARLRALLRRQAPQRPPVLRAGDLAMDPAKRTVQRGATSVELTPREFALLEFLLHNKDIVRTKQEILSNVWDPHHEGPANIVEVYIGYLRRKIDVPFGRHSIETHRGIGYRLLDEI